MYTRANTYPDAPGHWTTVDGEYEFVKTANTWTARRRDSDRIIGSGPTLAAVMSLAGRHYMTPVGQWPESVLNAETGKSADCQWSRHVLCLAPSECKCRCHEVVQTARIPQTCDECGEVITPLQDIEWVALPNGEYVTYHTPAAHRDMGYRTASRT